MQVLFTTGLTIAFAVAAVCWDRRQHQYWARLGALLALGLWLGSNAVVLLLGSGLALLLWAGRGHRPIEGSLRLRTILTRAMRAEAVWCAVWMVLLLAIRPGDVMFIWCGTGREAYEQRITFVMISGLATFLGATVLVAALLLGKSLMEWLALWRGGPLQRRLVGLVLLEVLGVILYATAGPLIRGQAEGMVALGLGRAIGVIPGGWYWPSEGWTLLGQSARVLAGLAASMCLFQSLWQESARPLLRPAQDS